MRRLLLALSIAASLLSAAQGRVIYVDNQRGDDRAEGRQLATTLALGGPVRSIAKALRLAEAGDQVIVANTGQPYRESISLNGLKNSGGPAGPFVIQGNGAVLNGSAPVDPRRWSLVRGELFSFQPARMGYQQLFLSGQPLKRHPSPPAGPVPALAPLEWCFWNGSIFFRPEATKLPQDYEFECGALATGITLNHVRGVVIENLVLEGFAVDGVNVLDGCRYISLDNLHCHHNGRAGITVAGSCHVEIHACQLEANGDAQLRTEGEGLANVVDAD